MAPVLIGSLGVALLLVAFVLNLLRILKESSRTYLLMNFIGAAAACWYAWVSSLIPFVILESVWGLTALVRLLLGMKNKKKPRPMAEVP